MVIFLGALRLIFVCSFLIKGFYFTEDKKLLFSYLELTVPGDEWEIREGRRGLDTQSQEKNLVN